MTNPTQKSLLGEDAYRNPRYAQEAAEFEASQAQAQAPTEAQGQEPTATSEPVHDWKKRYTDLQSWSSKEMHQMRQEIANLKADIATQKTPVLTAPKTAEEMAAFKAQNPEMYGVIQTMAHDIAKAHLEQTDLRVAAISQDLQQSKAEKARLAIQSAHPDFEAIVNSNEFQAWAQLQSQEVQGWIFNNPDDPDKAIRALNLYKYEAGVSQQTQPSEPQVQADLAVTNTATGGDNGLDNPQRIWTASEIRKIPNSEYHKYSDMIDLANREGRVDHSR